MLDDLKPGYDMARACGVPFAAAGWANDIPEIEGFMRHNCDLYFKTVEAFGRYLFD
jgi:phosphoglycolate phosphatase/pyrophosphatase PpaX